MYLKFRRAFLVSLFFFVGCLAIMAFNVAAYQFTSSPLANVYVPLAFIGQAFAMSLLLLLVLLPFFWLPTRLFSLLFAVLAGTSLFLLAIDSWVFAIYRFHINAFFINMFFSDMAGMGIEPLTVLFGVVGWLLIVLLLFAVSNWFAGHGKRLKLAVSYATLFILTLVGQGIHAWGYAHNMKKIVSLTYTIPLYYPLIATKDIKKMGWFQEALVEDNLAINIKTGGGFNYPRAALNCPATSNLNIIVATVESWRFDRMNADVTPFIFNMGQQGLVFNNHLSSGTVTDRGLFGLMYGTTPAYLNSAIGAGREPALVQAVRNMNYQTWILANQDIEINKLDQLFFPNIQPLQSTGQGKVYEGDQGIVEQLISKIETRQTDAPFFGYLLFNASHFSYWTPPDYNKPFEPSERFSPSRATDETEPEPYFNQYSNSIHFIDSLVGQLQTSLQEQGLWENTLLVITGDHGEEFKDQSVAYWGHGSNFARFQSGVPLVIHWPGQPAQSFTHRTSHEDVFATIVTEALNCDVAFSDISTGHSLFDTTPRVNVLESYVNQAIITGDVVTELYPGFVKTYSINDITEERKASAKSVQEVQRVLSHFR